MKSWGSYFRRSSILSCLTMIESATKTPTFSDPKESLALEITGDLWRSDHRCVQRSMAPGGQSHVVISAEGRIALAWPWTSPGNSQVVRCRNHRSGTRRVRCTACAQHSCSFFVPRICQGTNSHVPMCIVDGIGCDWFQLHVPVLYIYILDVVCLSYLGRA